MNYFELLGIGPTVDEDQIKKAYISMMRKYHPDVFVGDKNFAEEKSAEINRAYQVLHKPSSRQAYMKKNNLGSYSNVEKNNSVQKKESPPVVNVCSTNGPYPIYNSQKSHINNTTIKINIETVNEKNPEPQKTKKGRLKDFFEREYGGENKGKLFIDTLIFLLASLFAVILLL